MYLARTKDAEVEALIHQALRETMDDMESAIQTPLNFETLLLCPPGRQ